LCELLFEPNKIIQQIKTQKILFLRFTAENAKAQKYLLRGFELTVKEFRTQLMARVPHILKAFYDEDILDEKVILEWGSKVQKKGVGKEIAQEIFDKASPFIKWLKEAEEEESESEDEENIEVVYDDRLRSDKIQIQIEEQPKLVLPATKKLDDDIDIDAI